MVEAGYYALYGVFVTCYRVEALFHLSGELVVDYLGEIALSEVSGNLAEGSSYEELTLALYVVTRRDYRYDRCIGRGSAYAVFLKELDKRCLGVSCRRLGIMLFLDDLLGLEDLALFNLRKLSEVDGVRLLIILVGLILNVKCEVALILHYVTAGLEEIAVVLDFYCYSIEDGGRHLAGNEALPNELVELILLECKHFSYLLGRNVYVRGTNCLVCIL